MDCEWGALGAPSVCLLFRGARATPALLGLLEDTRVGRMPGQILFAGGDVEDERELKEIEMWPQEAEEAESKEESENEDRPVLPSIMYSLSFVFPFVLYMTSGVEGRSWGYPTMTVQAGPEVGIG